MTVDNLRSPAFVQTSRRAMKLGGGLISDQIDAKSISNEYIPLEIKSSINLVPLFNAENSSRPTIV